MGRKINYEYVAVLYPGALSLQQLQFKLLRQSETSHHRRSSPERWTQEVRVNCPTTDEQRDMETNG